MSESVDQVSKETVILTDWPTYYYSPALSDQEWLELYPEETREMLREKLIELEPEAAKLRQEIVGNFKIASLSPEDINTWLVYDYMTEISLVPRYLELKRQTKRFKWLLAPPRAQKGGLSEADVEHARQVPLEAILGLVLRSAGGGKQKALCPFHSEQTPSFIIFPDNYYHCFSCGKHGNSIGFLMEKEKLSFPEAVAKLKGY
jgi:hypothetical protein